MSELDNVRKSIVFAERNEHELREDSPMAKSSWEKLQALKHEMNDAKMAAVEAAAKPFLEKIEKAEDAYALALRLAAQ